MAGYGKIFTSIYDGTLYGHWEAIVTFQQMIVLADAGGIVDMTVRALSARTSIPIEVLDRGIAVLEAPDPESRTPAEDGRRIVRLDQDRPWGWSIVNHARWRSIAGAGELRESARDRMNRLRDSRSLEGLGQSSVRIGSGESEPFGSVRIGNVGSVMQKAVSSKQEAVSSTEETKTVAIRYVLPNIGGGSCRITDETIEQYRRLYPGVDVDRAFRTMTAWLDANPDRRKTVRGMPRFINAWLARDSERVSAKSARTEGDEAYLRRLTGGSND